MTATRERRILVCYDGSPAAERALARTAELASAVPSHVTVISVAEPIYQNPPYTGWADPEEEREHRQLIEDATRMLAEHGVNASSLEPVGQTADMIGDAARTMGADLIVVGATHCRLLRRLGLGGELAADAPCDVLVVR